MLLYKEKLRKIANKSDTIVKACRAVLCFIAKRDADITDRRMKNEYP
jgi:hypothetical protein